MAEGVCVSEWITDHKFVDKDSGSCFDADNCRTCNQSVDIHTETDDPFWSKQVSLNATIAQQAETIRTLRAALEWIRDHQDGKCPPGCDLTSVRARAALAATEGQA